MPDKQIQEYLFQRINEALPQGGSLAEAVAEILHISQDSAYRRIRGETLLVLEEARVLCQAYNISLDQLLNLKGNSVVFQHMEHQASIQDFTEYLAGIEHELKELNSFQQKGITYLTNDIPFFYQACYKPLFAFRYFFWMKTMVHHPDFLQRKFSLDCLPPHTEALGREVLQLYCQVPSTEIWNTECVNGLLIQMNYYLEAGIMNRDQASEVYGALQKALAHIHLQAEYGRKYLPGENPLTKKENYQLFHNRTGLGDNLILTARGEAKKLYVNYDALSYMSTTDEAFCQGIQHQLLVVMRRSTLISSVSEKQRNIFFNSIYRKIPLPDKSKAKLSI